MFKYDLAEKGSQKVDFDDLSQDFAVDLKTKMCFFSTSRTPTLLDFEICTLLGKSGRFSKKSV